MLSNLLSISRALKPPSTNNRTLSVATYVLLPLEPLAKTDNVMLTLPLSRSGDFRLGGVHPTTIVSDQPHQGENDPTYLGQNLNLLVLGAWDLEFPLGSARSRV